MSVNNYDSELCGSLPIHLINTIQPHGALLVVDNKGLNIIQCSENIEQVFQRAPHAIVGTPITDLLGEEQASQLTHYTSSGTQERLPASWTIRGNSHLALVHPKETYSIIELEIEPLDFSKQDTFVKVFQELRVTMAAIQAAQTAREACDIAAMELKRLSGFDKVMIYSFDEQWNGTVITELMEAGMESYLGFTFPASDIPRQARQLYQKNPYRLIPDRNYRAVKLHPVINPSTQAFIDLSDCNLRAVAGVHLEYLANMGVVASMSIRIMEGERLWGLVACHHRSAKNLSFQTCSVFEMLSGILSAKVAALITKASHALESALHDRYTRFIEEAYKDQPLDEALLHPDHGLLKLFDVQGVVVAAGGRFHSSGDVPDKTMLDDLILWLHTRQLRKNLHTESLQSLYEPAASFREIASGALVIPIDFHEDQYVILFRPEVVRTITWGGNPEDRIQFEADEKKYHPRSSFKQWQQIVEGHSIPWRNEELGIAEKLRGFIFEHRLETASGRSR